MSERLHADLTNKVPLIGDDGNVLGICGVGFDITRQKEMEQELKNAQFDLEKQVKERTSQLTKTIEQLQEAEWRYRTVADFTYDWEYWTNLDGSLKYVSPSCERISGYTPEQFMDKPSLYREIVESSSDGGESVTPEMIKKATENIKTAAEMGM